MILLGSVNRNHFLLSLDSQRVGSVGRVSSEQVVWLGPHLCSWSFTLQFGTENGDQDLRFFNQFLHNVRKEKNIWPFSGNPLTLQMASPNSSS